MDRAFWLERWQSNRIGWHLEQVNPHLTAFWDRVGARPDARVFVPLCGKSLDLYWLARTRGHRVVGVELSEDACRAFYAEHGLTPVVHKRPRFTQFHAAGVELLAGDFFDLDACTLGPVDAVFDRAALIALPPAQRPYYAAHMQTLLPHRPPALLVALSYPEGQMQGPPFSVQRDELDALLGPAHHLACLRDWDVLEEHPGFRDDGLTALQERVYLLTGR